ncbi:MAG: CSLREA domain-containing protein, partial [Rhodanobacteraceae bacterium]
MKRITATIASLLGAIMAPAAMATTYTVNYLADYADPNPGDGVCAGNGNTNFCTLRAAIQTANAHAGADVIVVPGGTYVLSLHGAGEDNAATGDLDITDSVTIQAQTAGVVPVIDGDGADRIFDIKQENLPSYDVTLNGLHLTHGLAGP